MSDTKETVLSKWQALKSPKGLIGLAAALAAALGGAVYMGDGFTITVTTCDKAEEAPEPEVAPEPEPEVAPEPEPDEEAP